MLQTARNISRIRSFSGFNWLMYYIKRIPLVGRLVKDSVYADAELKETLSILVTVLRLLKAFVTKFLYVGLMLYMPVQLGDWSQEEKLALFWHAFFVLSFLVVLFSSAKVMEPKRDKYICVKLMGILPRDYMRTTLLQNLVTLFVTFVPPVLLFSTLLGATAGQGLLFTFLLAAWRVAVEALNLLVFDRMGVILVKQNGVVWIAILAGYALAYGPLAAGWPLMWVEPVLLSVPAFTVTAVISANSALYLARYPHYRAAVMAVTKIDEPLLNVRKMMVDSQVADVKKFSKDFSSAELMPGKHDHKTGFHYLNAIFFERHRRLLSQPVKIRLLIIAGVFAAGLAASQLAGDLLIRYMELLIGSLPIFIFVMNTMSIGEKVCKAMYYNCDNSLLRYGFYREKRVLLQNFRVRLLRITGLNLIPAGALCAAVAILAAVSGVQWPLGDMLIYLLAVLGLAVFFSVHHLFMYYIFQPYTAERGMKSPAYFIINTFVLFLCVMALQIRQAPAGFTLVVLGAVAAYIALAVTLVYRLSPRTFRVK